MKKSIFLFFAAILCAMTANAAYYLHGSKTGNDWPGKEMTQSADGYYYYYKVTSGTHEFKVTSKSDWSGTEYTTVKSKYNGTDVAVTGGNGSNCKITNCASDHYVIIYPKNTLVNNTNNYYVCASTTLPDGIGEVHFKHPWGGGSWTYQTATNNGDGTFSYVGNYGDAGLNWCVLKDGSGEKYVSNPTLVGSPVSGDKCVFTFNAADQTFTVTKQVDKNIGSVTITMTCNQQPNIYYFGGVDGSVTYPEWPGVNMADNGDGTYSYKVDNVDLDLGLDYVITLKKVNENEWKSEDLKAKADVSHDVSIFNFPKIVVLGIDGKWDETNALTEVSSNYLTVSKTITFAAAGTHNLKCHVGDAQYQGGSVVNITRANPSSNKFDADHGGDGKFTADIAGDYIFTWTYKTKTLTVTYPDMPKYTVAAQANDENMGSVSGAGEFNQGETATLTATPKDGYVFVNWTKNDVEVSTAVEYSFEVTENVSLVANFEAAVEETHNVTVSYLFGSTPVKEALVVAVGVSTGVEITAPAKIDGRYAFQSWTLGSGVTSTDAKVNPINVTTLASGEYALTANYEDTYTTIYFVNTKSWPTVNAYVWGTGDPYKPWSGEAMTLTGDKAHGYDVYSYSFPAEYTNCIFNGNGQTDNLVVNAGQYYDIASKKWYATLAEVPSPAPIVMETVYLINTGNWEKVHAHAWNGAVNNGWPGEQLTENGEKIAEFDVYPFEAEQGQWTNIIFNCGGDECKTGDLTWQAGKYYAPSKDKWYDDAAAAESALGTPAVITYQLKGVGGWSEAGIEMTENPDKAGEYKLTCQAISATDAVKVVKLADGVITDYYGNGTVKDGVEVTVNYDGDGNITLPEGTYDFYFDTNEAEKKLWIAAATGCAPAVTTINVTLSGMVATPTSRMGSYRFLSLDDEDGNQISIFNGSEGAYGDNLDVNAYLAEYDVTVVGTGDWTVVDGVETLVATLQVEDDNTTIYNVTATVGAATTLTLECFDATYTITDPSLNEVTITGIADGKEFTIMVAPDGAGYYSEGEWGDAFILATSVTFDDSDPEAYALEGTYIDDASNTYEVLILATPAAVEPTPDYTRTTTAGKFGTICLPFGGEIEGAELYECVGKETGKVYIASVTTLEAGKPYIFKATAAELAVYSDGTTAPAGNHNGLYGTFNNETVVAAGDYILLNNELRPSDGTAKVNENRAYLVMSKVPEGAPTKMPGRRYVSMSVTGENEATGFENIITTNAPVKVIENGQLIIIRNGEKFNAQGQKL